MVGLVIWQFVKAYRNIFASLQPRRLAYLQETFRVLHLNHGWSQRIGEVKAEEVYLVLL
jgi:hypothetical protein